jgi:hypothetical protein
VWKAGSAESHSHAHTQLNAAIVDADDGLHPGAGRGFLEQPYLDQELEA